MIAQRRHPFRSLHRPFFGLLLFAWPLLFGRQAAAAPAAPAHWTVKGLPAWPLTPGAKFSLILAARIDPGWHIYALEEPDGGPLATEIVLADGDPLMLLSVGEATPLMFPDPFYKQPTGLFQNTAAFTLHLQIPDHALPRSTVLHIQVRYQSCNDKVCLPPHTDIVAVPLAPILR